MTAEPVLVGIDLGTSGLKGVALTTGGEIVASARAAYPTARPAPGRAEQDPSDWWGAIVSGARSLAADIGDRSVAGIGLSAMLPTLVLARGDGAPLGSAITWEDDRAEPDGERFREAAGADALYAETGQWVDGRYLLPMLRRIEREEPERAAAAAAILGAKDHVFRALTGEVTTDPTTATGFGCYGLASGAWNDALADGVAELLPSVRPSTFIAPLLPHAAAELGLLAGLPVALGAADSVCGVLGAGATARASLWGTSTAILGLAERWAPDPSHRYLVTPLALGDGWGLEMDLLSTGGAIGWLARTFGVPEAEVVELAATAPPGANGVTFLPYLGVGEQGVLWDPGLRGTIDGLTTSHDRSDLARALLEGISLEVRRCLRVLDEAGVPAGPMVVAGGATGSGSFAAMLAGATGAAVARVEGGRWASARGAAIVAAAAVGEGDAEATVPPPPVSTVEPPAMGAVSWDALEARAGTLLEAVRQRR